MVKFGQKSHISPPPHLSNNNKKTNKILTDLCCIPLVLRWMVAETAPSPHYNPASSFSFLFPLSLFSLLSLSKPPLLSL